MPTPFSIALMINGDLNTSAEVRQKNISAPQGQQFNRHFKDSKGCVSLLSHLHDTEQNISTGAALIPHGVTENFNHKI